MKHLYCFLVFFFLCQCLSAQVAPDFTITDSAGEEHSLYADYLDKGTTVVIKMFFVSCPLCKPYNEPFQELYEEFGQGEDSVEFLLLTTKPWDSNEDVADYKIEYNLTFPGAGEDGGGYDATAPYRNGDFGVFFGSPTFLVIEPNKTVHFDLAASGVDATIAKVREKIIEVGNSISSEVEGTEVNIGISEYLEKDLPPYRFLLRAGSGEPEEYEVPAQFTYPSAEYPELQDPELTVEIDELSYEGVTTIDIVIIQRSILRIIELDALQRRAADVNGDDKVSVSDILAIRKLILGLKDEFDVGKTWDAIDRRCNTDEDYCTSVIKLDTSLDKLEVDFAVIKYGDVK